MHKSAHLERRYAKVNVIGRGTYGTVYKGIDNDTGRTVAIKVIDLESTEDDINEIMKEIIALRDCDSKYVTEYYHSFSIGPELWIVMEYLGGGSVHSFLDAKFKIGIDEQYVKIIANEVVAGLAYLHSLKKIHRDIKAANILLSSEGNVKLADFGVVGQLSDTIDKRMTVIGSPYWMAPEVIMRDAYDQSADIWSLGVTCIEMALGAPPFSHLSPYPAMLKITKYEPSNVPENKFSEEFRDFIAQCLNKHPSDRPSAADLVKHSWLKNCGSITELKQLVIAHQQSMEQNAPMPENKSDSEFDDYPYKNANWGDVQKSLERKRDLRREYSVEFTFGTVSTLGGSPQMTPRPPMDDDHGYLYDDEEEDGDPFGDDNDEELFLDEDEYRQRAGYPDTYVDDDEHDAYGHENGRGGHGVDAEDGDENGDEDRDVDEYEDEDDEDGMHLHDDDEGDQFGTMVRAHPKANPNSNSNAIRDPHPNNRSNSSQSESEPQPKMSSPLDSGDVLTLVEDTGTMVRSRTTKKRKPATTRARPPQKKKKKKKGQTQMQKKKPQSARNLGLPGGSPWLKHRPSILSYSIGIQTVDKTTYNKETQTESETVTNLVGIYKEMDDLFTLLEESIDSANLPHLQDLKHKVKQLTHMKIRERKLSKINSNDDCVLEAKERIRQIRERRQLQIKRMSSVIETVTEEIIDTNSNNNNNT